MKKLIEKYGLDKLNSLTKYPSILTYHNLGEKGTLLNTLTEGKSFQNQDYFVSEKINGTNTRIILYKNDFLIGSREEILYFKGDLIGNPVLNIVNTVKQYAEKLSLNYHDRLFVFYGETYGGNINRESKQYTSKKEYNYNSFDISEMEFEEVEDLLSKSINDIASWREHGGQKFLNLYDFYDYNNYNLIPFVPHLTSFNGNQFPTDLEKTYEYMKNFKETKAGIDFNGKSEGIVIRSFDRSFIRKLRFEEYEKTLKIK